MRRIILLTCAVSFCLTGQALPQAASHPTESSKAQQPRTPRLFVADSPAQTQREETAGVFVEMYETDWHKKRSKPYNLVRNLLDDVVSYLKSKKVVLAPDEASATYRLRLTVDRPLSRWIRVTVEAYDSTDKKLWQQVAQSGAWAMTGGQGFRDTIERLHKMLDTNLGEKGGLPLIAEHPELASAD